MVDKLEFCGFKKIKLDLCLFIVNIVIAVIYVEDILMWYTEDQNITDLKKLLNTEGVDLEEENDAAGFLGVHLTKTSGGSTMMTQ